ncbi:MAG TPA: cobalt ECF transporter T component CbiQ [Syntrophomonadaceae bacterium]|nr:cobalt ECF transporter T component CbiQ [Syntrophomonadaceae bacterium]
MIGMEDHSYHNRWRAIHPRDKIAFALVTLLLGLFSCTLLPPLSILLAMGFITVFQAKVPGSFYLKLFCVPAGFLLVGAVSVALILSTSNTDLLYSIRVGAYYLGVTNVGINQAVLLLTRSASAVSCVLFLSLTTPLEDLTGQLERWKVPYIIIEMMTLIYRFIFIFWEQAVVIHTAQAARLGHVDPKTSLRSLGYLLSSLFLTVIKRSNALYNALVARGYSDCLRFLEEEHLSTPWRIKLGFVGFDLLLLGLVVGKGSAWL